jgi:hypothetical protein
MFTLPIDKTLPIKAVPAGKKIQPSTWNLTVTVEPGVTMNETTWAPGQGLDHYDQNNIVVEILLGNSCLLKTRLDTKKLVFSKNIADTCNPQRENLIIKLSGKPDNPDLKDNNHIAIKIDVLVEHLSIIPLFETHGCFIADGTSKRKVAGDFIGENGQQAIEIYTPIYVWLVQHQRTLRQSAQKG